jgi:putative transposase
MPRQARLDAPGPLHHVIIRGIERSLIFKDNQDRQDFIEPKSENTLIDKKETLLFLFEASK